MNQIQSINIAPPLQHRAEHAFTIVNDEPKQEIPKPASQPQALPKSVNTNPLLANILGNSQR